jgi:competence protein ComEC
LRLADELPAALEGRDIELTGVVAGLPQELERGVRFEFDVEQAVAGVPPRISLAWYRGRDDADDEASPLVPVRAGERWRFTVRLKRPHGNLNPHGFDYEAWLFERGIRATGYVRPASAARIEARSGVPVMRWRCCAKPSATAFAPCCRTRRMRAS